MPNGVDAERFSPGDDRTGLRERLGIPADAVVAAFVATLDRAHHFKRLDVAIDALADLGDQSVHIVVAGGGELVDDFRRRGGRARGSRTRPFPGRRSARGVPDVPASVRPVLLTTEPPESFGIVLIEAMAAGLPVIATDYPGVRAVVADGTGLLRPTGRRGRLSPAACAKWSRWTPTDVPRWVLAAAGGQRRSGTGLGSSTGWTTRTHRQSPPGGRRCARDRSPRILFVSYFYPPCTDTGAHRPSSMVKYLRRAGHDVTVLTTSAYGRLEGAAEAGIERTADAQLWRAELRGAKSVGSMYDADTYSGKPHPLSKVIVPEPLALAWAPFAIGRAKALHREQPFDCVITTSPPESAHYVGRALQRKGAAWVADVRDAWTFEPLRPEFPTALQHRLDERLERHTLGAADVVVCVVEAGCRRPPAARRSPIRCSSETALTRAPGSGRSGLGL